MFTTIVFAVPSAAQPSVPTTIPAMWTDWCARCHAADGSGKVVEPTITVDPLDFSDCRVASAEPDAAWELPIARGSPAVGLSSEMPAFGDTLSPEQVRGLVDLLRRFCTEPGWPHGNMNFPCPIFTEKAFPENEVVVLPLITHRSAEAAEEHQLDVDLLTVYERRLGRRAMWEVVLPFSSHATGGTSQSGVGDIELEAKYVLHADQKRTRIVSAGLEVTLPTGSRTFGLFEPIRARR